MLTFIEIVLIFVIIITPFTENVCDMDLEFVTPTTFLYESFCSIESSANSIIDLAESYAVDEGNSEMFLYVSCIGLLGDVLGIFTIILPFIDDAESCDIALIVCDSFMLGAFYAIGLAPIFMYTTLCSMVTWKIPLIFNLFLPAIEILGKLLRSLNTTLRVSSNLTAGHLLLLLLFSATEVASSISMLLAGVLALFTSIILTIEAAIACMQGCIYTSLCLYYSHIDD